MIKDEYGLDVFLSTLICVLFHGNRNAQFAEYEHSGADQRQSLKVQSWRWLSEGMVFSGQINS
ncbi:hypothetical protein NC651_008627 [Populus alba x Populus x berolinensis]|nr:hypothetical protein NC651_008627 [Populus alba x Populus x berolinensis]